MKLILPVIILGFLSFNSYSQTDVELYLHPEGFALPSLFNNVSSVGKANPASLSEYAYPAAGFSYQAASEIKPPFENVYHISRSFYLLPNNAGFVYPLRRFSFGFAINQRYNYLFEPDQVDDVNTDLPEGTGDLTKVETGIYDFSLLSSIRLGFSDGNGLSLGMKLTLSRLSHFSGTTKELGPERNAYGFGFALGADYKLALSDENIIALGASYEKGAAYKKSYSVTMSLSNYSMDYLLKCSTPDILKINMDLSLIPHLKLIESLSYVFWNDVSADYCNQIESDFRAIYSPGEKLAYSLGIFYTDKRPVNRIFGLDDYNAVYLSAGISLNIKKSNLGFVISDSHMFSSERRKHTVAELLFGYNFR